MSFDLGFGPMSRESIKALAQWTIENDSPLMLIASRNQIEASDLGGGYVMDTASLGQFAASLDAPKLMLCRDHCGPYLAKHEKGLPLSEALERTTRSLTADMEAGFKLIHIDASACPRDEREVAETLIDHCATYARAKGITLEYEYGSEDNVGIAVSAEKFEQDLAFITHLIQPRYVVGQTGSLVRQARQAGTFDVAQAKMLVALADQYGTKLKEHNCDYLVREEIALRHEAKVGALNIAPELGVVQTQVTLELAKKYGLYAEQDAFCTHVITGNNWSKWQARSMEEMIDSAGHYHFNDSVYQDLIGKLAEMCDIEDHIISAIKSIVDRYAK
jgi:hypothetical protein